MASLYLVDIRSAEDYSTGHPSSAFSFPLNELSDLSGALPDRNCSLEVIVSDDGREFEKAQVFFTRLEYRHLLIRRVSEYKDLTQVVPKKFCFQPSDFLSFVIERVENQVMGKQQGGVALDVGCGSGRDMVFLASRGWTVYGVDNRFRLLSCANKIASKFGVGHLVGCIHMDVKRVKGMLRKHSYQLLHFCRFIHRESLSLFVDNLAIGGWVVYSHFLEGCEKTPVGHPKTSKGFFLKGELESLLEKAGVTIMMKEEKELNDTRPMIHILGRKNGTESCTHHLGKSTQGSYSSSPP